MYKKVVLAMFFVSSISLCAMEGQRNPKPIPDDVPTEEEIRNFFARHAAQVKAVSDALDRKDQGRGGGDRPEPMNTDQDR